jgi:hypothetical protein
LQNFKRGTEDIHLDANAEMVYLLTREMEPKNNRIAFPKAKFKTYDKKDIIEY